MSNAICLWRQYICLHWMVLANQDIRRRHFKGTWQALDERKDLLCKIIGFINAPVTQYEFQEEHKVRESIILGGFCHDPAGFFFLRQNFSIWLSGILIKKHAASPGEYTKEMKRWINRTVRNGFDQLYGALEKISDDVLQADPKDLDALQLLKRWEINKEIDLALFMDKQDAVSMTIPFAAGITLEGKCKWRGYIRVKEFKSKDEYLIICATPNIRATQLNEAIINKFLDDKEKDNKELAPHVDYLASHDVEARAPSEASSDSSLEDSRPGVDIFSDKDREQCEWFSKLQQENPKSAALDNLTNKAWQLYIFQNLSKRSEGMLRTILQYFPLYQPANLALAIIMYENGHVVEGHKFAERYLGENFYNPTNWMYFVWDVCLRWCRPQAGIEIAKKCIQVSSEVGPFPIPHDRRATHAFYFWQARDNLKFSRTPEAEDIAKDFIEWYKANYPVIKEFSDSEEHQE